MGIGKTLSELLKKKNVKVTELAEMSGVSKNTIYGIIRRDNMKASINSLLKICEVLEVDPEIFYDDWLEVKKETEFKVPNLYPIETQSFPLLGSVACGEPIFADENLELYVQAGTKIKADFCLRAKGDSMTGARIYDGDIVFVRRQPTVENGEIAVVLIEDEATLKRVHYDQEAGVLLLFPENPNYKIMRYSGEELNRIRILGKAIGFQGDVK